MLLQLVDESDTLLVVTMPDTLQKRHSKRRSKKQKLPPRRCLNDNRPFQPKLTIQKFCTDACRKQFHRYGSSYGPLKTGLEKAIDQRCEGIAQNVEFQIKAAIAEYNQYKRIQQLEIEVKNLRFNLEGLRELVEKHLS